jgi:hypothetical protein
VPIRALGGVLLVGGVVVEALHELTVPPGSSAAGPLFDDWLHDTLILASAGVCAAGARRHPRDARAWASIAAALLCIGLGEVVWGLLYENTNTAIPYPNPADAFDLASYPLFAAGLILIVRRRVPSIELHRWLDGLVIILVVATPMVARPVDGHGHGRIVALHPPDLQSAARLLMRRGIDVQGVELLVLRHEVAVVGALNAAHTVDLPVHRRSQPSMISRWR